MADAIYGDFLHSIWLLLVAAIASLVAAYDRFWSPLKRLWSRPTAASGRR